MFSKRRGQKPPQTHHRTNHWTSLCPSTKTIYVSITYIFCICYPKQTISPSKTLNPSLTYWINPKAVSLMSISREKMQLKMRLLTSTTLVRVSGWLWYSILILNELRKIQRRINCWNRLWSTTRSNWVLKWVKDLLNPLQHAETNLKKRKI